MKYVKGRRSYSMTINNNTTGTIVRIKKRKLGRRKLENIWGEEKWEVEGRVKGTSAYKIKFGQTCRVENRINLRVTKD